MMLPNVLGPANVGQRTILFFHVLHSIFAYCSRISGICQVKISKNAIPSGNSCKFRDISTNSLKIVFLFCAYFNCSHGAKNTLPFEGGAAKLKSKERSFRAQLYRAGLGGTANMIKIAVCDDDTQDLAA